MIFPIYTTASKEKILDALNSSEIGLSSSDVQKRINTYGPNQIHSNETTWFHILSRQFRSPFVYLLFAGSIIAFLLKERIDSAMILLFISINILLGFIQEFRSNQSVKLLKKYLQLKEKVLRDGKETEVDSHLIVPGDIIILEPGDLIPADLRFISSDNLTVDESVLTGESVPVEKTHKNLDVEVKDVYKANNIGFTGTTILTGKALGVVFATSDYTEYGKIAKISSEIVRESTFEKELGAYSKVILRIVLVTLIALFVINIFLNRNANISELAIFSVALAVSVIPEALPVVTTFSLSRGALLLAKKSVVVKRLSAIEDLGSIEVLATDKTGTITENKLKVEDTLGKNKKDILLFATLASPDKMINPFDMALWSTLKDPDKVELKKYTKLEEIPFDPKRRRSTVIIEKGKKKYIVSRGAPEDILKLCESRTPDIDGINKWISEKGAQGNRVLAVAIKEIKKDLSLSSQEKNLKFVGLIAFFDPIKESAFKAVNDAKSLGVKIKILTGDSLDVAISVALQTGLIKSPEEAITGDEFESKSTDEKHSLVDSLSVFARVTPEQKHNLIKLLEEKYEVGFLGEGINDAPALKTANVALVVDKASDIAREASDIVLLEKSLEVIIDGIKEGRKVFSNTTKYITATLSSNFGNFYAVAIASLLIDFLPMLPLQILLVNLLSDFPMISIATDNVDNTDIRHPNKTGIRSIIIKATILGIVSTFFDFLFFAFFNKLGPSVLQTNWFIGSILTELVFLFSVRTKLFAFQAIRPSKIVVALTITAAVATIFIPFSSVGINVFKFSPPLTNHLLIIGVLVFLYFASTETVKIIYNTLNNKKT